MRVGSKVNVRLQITIILITFLIKCFVYRMSINQTVNPDAESFCF